MIKLWSMIQPLLKIPYAVKITQLTTIEDTITNVKTPQIDYSITAEIYRAESLIPLDLASRSVDAFVVAKFSGQKVSS